MKQISFLFLAFYYFFTPILAQKPPVLTTNAPDYDYALSVAENFNKGRRFEELDKNLPVNSLGNMVLPADFATRPVPQRALLLINAERSCRNNANYGSGALVVKPLQGAETNLSETTQRHADWLVAQNKFDHCGDPIFGTTCSGTNSSASQRIQGNTKLINGWERNTENIGLVLSEAVDAQNMLLANEKMVFEMIYRNAPNWIHRDNFMQVVTDNLGEAGNEGFLGVGEKLGANYNPVNAPNQTYGKVIVYAIYDPKATATNAFSVVNSAITSTTFVIDSSKYYQIIAKHSNKALTVAKASQTIGAAVVQAALANVANQKWKIVPTTNGFYRLKSLNSGLSLDIRWGVKRQGARLQQWANQATSQSQEWEIVAVSNGYFKIVNRNSGFNLSVPIYSTLNDMSIVQLNELSYSEQLWKIVEVPQN
jgi:hypothetical protein